MKDLFLEDIETKSNFFEEFIISNTQLSEYPLTFFNNSLAKQRKGKISKLYPVEIHQCKNYVDQISLIAQYSFELSTLSEQTVKEEIVENILAMTHYNKGDLHSMKSPMKLVKQQEWEEKFNSYKRKKEILGGAIVFTTIMREKSPRLKDLSPYQLIELYKEALFLGLNEKELWKRVTQRDIREKLFQYLFFGSIFLLSPVQKRQVNIDLVKTEKLQEYQMIQLLIQNFN
ncbi:hypothetical protein TTHERM_01509170 (macronuclear) [Tetrahymena thermophila SB210]|uniref:Uncharacterized protein n=1 Tax=Tetrahymena thermophila (strain SB210) TaxID=312017 RepID=Q23EG8_TETTS|nr:hypothetical protein TTHERM_01509170 [Tetrahymena thermophila SB210]EAR94925.2 hypothetical protein TTHERM_01509170 [Tetrahymena thermophila SB210]|eukprot:XP_001015170.2 hypothetical protein TTHERM_01509170 [Tetrahymena thermophila SB210]